MLECDAAIQAAKKAGQIIKQRKIEKIAEKKNAGDIVTEADKASSRIIIDILKEHFPAYAVISEEEPFEHIPSGYVWVIDPLDGTLPYTLGFNYSAISIALLKDYVPILGVIYHPFLDEMYVAMKDGSAFCNGKKVKVNETGDLAHSTAHIEYSSEHRQQAIGLVSAVANHVRYPLSFGCGCYGLTRIAKGSTELFLHHKTCIWDIAAAVVVVEQAGGKVTDLKGKSLHFDKTHYSCIFSNGKIHAQVLHLIARTQKLPSIESLWDWIWRK